MPAQKRNGEIDFWKFAASLFIVLFHTRTFYEPDLFPSGFGMAVEFFFIVSGYFFAASVYRDSRPFNGKTIGAETLRFLWHKLKGFVYYFVIAFVFCAAAFVYQHGVRACLTAENILNCFFEFTLLSNVTGTPSPIIPADWYLSAMLAAMFLLYPFFRRNKDFFSAWAAPVLGVGALGYLLSVYGVLSASAEGAFPPKNVVRAVSAVCLGVAAWRAAQALKEKQLGRAGVCGCTAAAAVSLLGMFASLFFVKGKAQALTVVFAVIFVTVCMSGHSAFSGRFPAGICKKLGEFSLTLYLCHTGVRSFLLGFNTRHAILRPWFTNGPQQWYGVCLFLALSCAAALPVMLAANLLRKAFGRTREQKAAPAAVN